MYALGLGICSGECSVWHTVLPWFIGRAWTRTDCKWRTWIIFCPALKYRMEKFSSVSNQVQWSLSMSKNPSLRSQILMYLLAIIIKLYVIHIYINSLHIHKNYGEILQLEIYSHNCYKNKERTVLRIWNIK